MSASTECRCVAWMMEDNDEVEYSSSEAALAIVIRAQFVHHEIVDTLVLPRNHLADNNTSWSTVSQMLSTMNLPPSVHPTTIQQIMHCARSCSTNQRNVIIFVELLALQSSVTDDADALSQSFNSQVSGFVPSLKSSIEALMRVKTGGDTETCVICLEDMIIGQEALSMPCFHVYHEDCIKNWLQTSNVCPLCRFHMP